MSAQPPLLPPSPAAAARALLARALPELERLLSKRYTHGQHLATCRIGQWVGQWTGPDGAPCSPRCVEVRHLVTDLQAFLAGAE